MLVQQCSVMFYGCLIRLARPLENALFLSIRVINVSLCFTHTNCFTFQQCKPGYAGNGFHCGDDSDSDGIPDKALPCGGMECKAVSKEYGFDSHKEASNRFTLHRKINVSS